MDSIISIKISATLQKGLSLKTTPTWADLHVLESIMLPVKVKVGSIDKYFSCRKDFKTRRYAKDLDQIKEEITKGLDEKKKQQPVIDEDAPGMGLFYCFHCAKHHISERALQVHSKSKSHKKRLKRLNEPAYTQAESEAAIGLGVIDH